MIEKIFVSIVIAIAIVYIFVIPKPAVDNITVPNDGYSLPIEYRLLFGHMVHINQAHLEALPDRKAEYESMPGVKHILQSRDDKWMFKTTFSNDREYIDYIPKKFKNDLDAFYRM